MILLENIKCALYIQLQTTVKGYVCMSGMQEFDN